MLGLAEDVLVDSEEEILAGLGEEILIEVDLVEVVLIDLTVVLVDLAEAIEAETEVETGILKGMRCIQQYAINAARTVKFLSSQPRENLFTAVIVLETKAGKLVQGPDLEDHLKNQLTMQILTKSTKNLTGF